MSSSTTSTRGFAAINGTELYFETKGAGAPLLLLHAGVGDSRMWDHQFDVFAQTNFVIRCDLRGFGKSRKAPGVFAHYHDISALLHYLKVDSTIIVGASFGGAVALDVAIAYPEQVTTLVLVAPALGGYQFTSEAMFAFFTAEEEALAKGDLQAATEANLIMWVDGVGRSSDMIPTDVRKQVEAMQFAIFAQPDVADMTEHELEPPAIDQLYTIQIPTLVLVGDHDAAEFQTIAKHITEHIPHAQYAVIVGTAHLSNMEQPELFNQRVMDFLT